VRVRGVDHKPMEFAEFYQSARDECLRIVVLNVGDRQLAEDLVAEGFTRAWIAWRQVRELDVPRAWVVRAALNTHISWWRRRRRETVLGSHERAAPEDPHERISDDLLAVLRRLPRRQREVVTLRLLLDLDTSATARILGIAEGTVGAHLHRAVTALRAVTASYDHQEARK
jgi:RNA polymerase sigma-70 factor (sigma-E family)